MDDIKQGQELGPQIEYQDLSIAMKVIEVAIERGTFKPNEVEMVGKLYNKFSTFLSHAKKQQEEALKAQEAANAANTEEKV